LDLSLEPPGDVFDALVERYSEPHRAYHTLQHIAECFDQFDHVRDAVSPGTVGLALWFHDAIYDTRAQDNEAESARYAHDVLGKAGGSKAAIAAVERMIMATRHNAVPEEHDDKIVVDIDLSILGAGAARFDEYENQIRQEYAWVDEVFFGQARAAVLRSFLNRRFIYSTEDFRSRLELRARHNLTRSMRRLVGAA
jgi:predicted metal-dependent HD superfamily phosphohydrolase